MGDLRSSVVRVVDLAGRNCGTGFLLSHDGLIATCAHVVAEAGAGAGDVVGVVFQVAGERRDCVVVPEFWREPDREDVGLLQVSGGVPDGAVSLALRAAANSTGNRFSAYGFPRSFADQGGWGYGMVGNFVTDQAGVERLQLSMTSEITQGFSGGPVVDLASGLGLGMVLSITSGEAHDRLTRTAFVTPTETLRAIYPQLRVAAVCPYRSLEHFGEEHAAFFFGRSRITESLIRSLAADPRFLAILGPSGSGKSSLLRAGLAARLRADALPGSSGWNIEVKRPAELTQSADVPPAADGARPVLMIDQFEELFGLDPATAQRCAADLARLAGGASPVTVVIAMRDDFYSVLARELPDLMNRWVLPNLVNIPAELRTDELTEIIEGPARWAGLTLEAGLTQAIIGGAIAASDDGRLRSTLLPLIEFALTQLWQRQDDDMLRLDVFEQMGGVAGSLRQWADASFYALPDSARPVARRIFTALAQLGDERLGTLDSRRRRTLDDLADRVSAADFRDVLGSLVTARLLATSRDESSGLTWVELIHDSLLREWGLLTGWLTEDREFLGWRQALDYRLGTWTGAETGDHRDDLDWLGGRELAQAEHWLRTRPADLGTRQRAFIEGSLAARARQQQREDEQRARLEAQRAEADRQRQVAQTRGLIQRLRTDAENSAALVALDPPRALALAIAVTGANLAELSGEPLSFVQANLFSSVRMAKERRLFTGHAHLVTRVAIDPGGRWVVTGARDRTVRLWPMLSEVPPTVLGTHADDVLGVAISPRSDLIASCGGDLLVRLWSPDGQPASAPLEGATDSLLDLAFAPDGRSVAAACADGTVYVWPLQSNDPLARIRHGSYVASLAFSPDGQRIVAGCGDGTVWLAHIDSPERPILVGEHGDFVSCARFHPAGDLIATSSGDGTIRLWPVAASDADTADKDPPTGAVHTRGEDRARVFMPSQARHNGLVTCLAFAADGKALVFGDEDGTVRLWDLSGNPAHPPLICPRQAVTSVAVSDDSRWIVGTAGTRVYIWDFLPYPPAPSAPAHVAETPWDANADQAGPAWSAHDFIAAVAFTPDGTGVVTAGGDRNLRVWGRDGSLRSSVPNRHDGGVTTVACSPGSRELIVSGGRDNMVRLTDLSGRPLGGPMAGHTADVMAVAFRPDGAVIASGSRDGTVMLWWPDGRQYGPPISGGGGEVLGVAFSPDGQLLAAVGEDGAVRLWQLDGSPVGRPFTGHVGHAWDVTFNPAGDVVMSCGDDQTVRLWDRGGEPVCRPLRGHTGGVRAGRFHPGGHMMVTAGADGAIRTWHLDGGQLTRAFEGHHGQVFALALDPHGDFAVTGGEDGTARVWKLGDWRSWLREGCARMAGHPLFADASDEAGRAAREACQVAASRE